MEGSYQEDRLSYRGKINRDKPAVLFLPGIHGDWTHLGRARPLLSQSLNLVEIAYPRIADWEIEDFVRAVEAILDEIKADQVHVVAESFGSLVGWELTLRQPRRVKSLTLVGGFVQPPGVPKVGLARWGLSALPTPIFESGIDLYTVLRGRNRRKKPASPQKAESVESNGVLYPASRTRKGRLALVNRLRLIQSSDYRGRLSEVRVPVRYVGGDWDWIVPVKREIGTLASILPGECRFESHLIPRAPHVIISSHPEPTAERIIGWVREAERA